MLAEWLHFHFYVTCLLQNTFLSSTQEVSFTYMKKWCQYYQREIEPMEQISKNDVPSTNEETYVKQVQKYCENSSIYDLLKGKRGYPNEERDNVLSTDKAKDSQHKIHTLVKYIKDTLESPHFPLPGRVVEIGSWKDGSIQKPMDVPDLMEEIDLLFVLTEKLEDIKGVRHFCYSFSNCLDEVFSSDVPAGSQFSHGGYASQYKKYSGVRFNGAATTVLLKFHGYDYTTFLNITPCFPEDMDENVRSWVNKLWSYSGDRTVLHNPMTHLVANAVADVLDTSTASIEADLLCTLQQSVIHEAYLRGKALLHMADYFASKIYDEEENKGKREGSEVNNGNMKENTLQNREEDIDSIETEDTERNMEENMEEHNKSSEICNSDISCLVKAMSKDKKISDIERRILNRRLMYEHDMLPRAEAKKHGELSKPHISANCTAFKYSLLHNSSKDAFQSIEASKDGGKRVFDLLEDCIRDFSAADTQHVEHPADEQTKVLKFLCRRSSLPGNPQRKAIHQRVYEVFKKYTFSKVGIIQV